MKIIYEDKDLLVVDKPAGLVVFPEGKTESGTLIEELIKEKPELTKAGETPRYGIVHRLDKDTSGVLLVAKSTEALKFFQKQFSAKGGSASGGINTKSLEKTLEKRYIVLVCGNVENNSGVIHTLIARSKKDFRKQKVFELGDLLASASAREAITEYKVLKDYKDYTLLEVVIKTGRRHQIRCHFSYLQHPIAGDKLYAFKNSKIPAGLKRQFLHSAYLKIQLPSGKNKEFESSLPEDLQEVLSKLKKYE